MKYMNERYRTSIEYKVYPTGPIGIGLNPREPLIA